MVLNVCQAPVSDGSPFPGNLASNLLSEECEGDGILLGDIIIVEVNLTPSDRSILCSEIPGIANARENEHISASELFKIGHHR